MFANSVGSFQEKVLVTSATDSDLVNPWGIALSGTGPFWISDNGTGKSTLYNTAGTKLGLVVNMPVGSEPITGQVFNHSAAFNGDNFLFASENGTIAGWRGTLGTTAEPLFSEVGAVYKGLAISTSMDTLYAANFAKGTIDVFHAGVLTGTFGDATVPAGYAPFNIQNVGGKFYVTFALRNGIDDVAGPGHGFVDIFDPATNTFSRVVSQGALNSPWGLAVAPSGFGSIGGDLLVGNFGDGLINIYDPLTFALVGALADSSNNPLANDGLWGLSFGNGGIGGLANTLYLTAGSDHESGGLFAQIDAIPEPGTILLSCLGFALIAFGKSRKDKR